MNGKRFSVLLAALLLVVLGIVLLLPGEQRRDQLDAGTALLPGLRDSVNEVDRIVVSTAGDKRQATLERQDDGWTLAEFSGYPADMALLREVLAGLAEAQVLERKTANPDFYARLGVEDVSGDDASGTRLDLEAGEQRWSLIVGTEAPSRGGHYLRLVDSQGSVLADFDADVPAEAAGWVDDKVIDLLSAEVAEVRVARPFDQGTITARKISADETDFTLVELPEGRELKSAWSINSLGSALSTLDFESVQRESDGKFPNWDNAFQLRAVQFDGLTLDLSLLRLESGDFVKLAASAPFTEATGEPDAALQERVRVINERVSGWVYRIPAFKADAMDKQLEDLLREPQAEDTPPGTAG